MKISLNILSVALALVSATASGAEIRSADLVGAWNCGPFTMAGKDFDIKASYTSSYLSDGSFSSASDVAVHLATGKVVKTRDRSVGSWTLKGDVIEIKYEKVEFLSSDDPAYTVQMGQAASDAQQKKKNWSTSKILELGEKLVTIPVDAMHKEAEVTVTCVRP